MSQKINARVGVVGVDIGKNSFRIVGQDYRGEIVLRQKWSQVEARFVYGCFSPELRCVSLA